MLATRLRRRPSRTWNSPPRRRVVHWIALALITLLSLLFGALPAIGGILQRVLWIVGFAWLAYLGTGEKQ